MNNLKVKISNYLFFVLLSCAYFISTVGNISLGISQASSDDGIISHVLSYVYPQRFINDLQANTFRIETPTSLMNLLPTIAYDYLNIDPTFFWILFLILQTLLFPISIYGITNLLTRSKKKAALVTLFLINIRPQTRNLSYSGDLDWMPYAMWLAESFFVLAIYLYLRKFRNTAFVVIIIACMTHPSLGVWILFLFVLYDYLATKNIKYSWRAPLSTILLFSAFITYNLRYIREQSAIKIDSDYLKSVLTNNHFNSISIFTNDFELYAVTNSAIIMLIGMTVYFIFTPMETSSLVQVEMQILIKVAYLVSIIGILSQVFGLLTENLTLVRLMGSRFTSILAIFSFILFLIFLLDEKFDDNFSLILLTTFIFFPGAIIVWCYGIRKAIIGWSIASLNKRLLFISLTLLSFVTSIRLLVFLIDSLPIRGLDSLIQIFDDSNLFVRNFFFNFLSIKSQFFLYVVVLTILFAAKNIWSSKLVIDLLRQSYKIIIISFVFLLVIGKESYSSDRFSLRDLHFKQIQEWARYQSTPDSSYLVLADSTYGGWRNYSRRAQISLSPSFGPYGVYKDSISISERIQGILRKYPTDNLNSPSEALLDEMKLKLSLDYLITSTYLKKYSFEIVFQNKDFIIYKL